VVIVWTFLTVFLIGYAIRELAVAPRRRLQTMLDRVGRTEVDLPLKQRLTVWMRERVIQRLPLLTGAGSMDELRELVLWAGRPFGLGAEEFYFAQVVLAVMLGLLAMSSYGVLGAIGGGVVGVLFPRYWLRARVANISQQLRRELPQFVHLLATCLEAGLGLNEGIRRVAEESPGQLAREMQRTIFEIAAGKPSQRAWGDLMDRTNCEELREIVTSIMQSQEYGVGIAEQLRFTMRSIRQRKQQQATQKAQEASVKMRVPMVLFILMPTLLIVLGPSGANLMRMFGGK
jgi:tight adherence protein C